MPLVKQHERRRDFKLEINDCIMYTYCPPVCILLSRGIEKICRGTVSTFIVKFFEEIRKGSGMI